ncbi:MAG: 30S ribosomal protein S5 [Candidatus Pacebacteria bacterium]|nr:30S ribosomal protein S5 [Candidatus Paceibacterota bacterium]
MSEEVTKEQAAGNDTSIKNADTSAANQESKKAPAGADTVSGARSGRSPRGGARRNFGGKKPFRKGSRFRSERPKPEFEQKIINISRVTRVVKGGRRLSFRVDMAIGDKKGRVGLGSGKATDTSLAIQKAFAQARKNLIKVRTTKTHSLEHAVEAKVTAARVELMPNKGRGLVAGSTMRTMLQLAGITDVTGRIHSRSKNKLNNAKATIEALRTFSMPLPKVTEAPKRNDRRGGRGGRFNKDRGGRRAPSNR